METPPENLRQAEQEAIRPEREMLELGGVLDSDVRRRAQRLLDERDNLEPLQRRGVKPTSPPTWEV